jgi:hypothetical protein
MIIDLIKVSLDRSVSVRCFDRGESKRIFQNFWRVDDGIHPPLTPREYCSEDVQLSKSSLEARICTYP